MDESALELVRDWLARAGRDLRSARLLATADDPPPDISLKKSCHSEERRTSDYFLLPARS